MTIPDWKTMAAIPVLAFVSAANAVGQEISARSGNPPPPLVFRPDAMVRSGSSGPFSGNDIYNRTGASQTSTARIARGGTVTFAVRFQNDGNITDSFLLKPGGNPPSGVAISYWRKGVDITPIVEAGKFSTGDLAPGQGVSLVVKVFARRTATKGSVMKQPLTLVSRMSPNFRDTVVVRVRLLAF
jgi:hypothetical protein